MGRCNLTSAQPSLIPRVRTVPLNTPWLAALGPRDTASVLVPPSPNCVLACCKQLVQFTAWGESPSGASMVTVTKPGQHPSSWRKQTQSRHVTNSSLHSPSSPQRGKPWANFTEPTILTIYLVFKANLNLYFLLLQSIIQRVKIGFPSTGISKIIKCITGSTVSSHKKDCSGSRVLLL